MASEGLVVVREVLLRREEERRNVRVLRNLFGWPLAVLMNSQQQPHGTWARQRRAGRFASRSLDADRQQLDIGSWGFDWSTSRSHSRALFHRDINQQQRINQENKRVLYCIEQRDIHKISCSALQDDIDDTDVVVVDVVVGGGNGC